MSGYVELQVLTHFSFLRGASSPAELFSAAALLGYTAIGIGDIGSVAGVGELAPLLAGNDTGNEIKRNDFFGGVLVPINCEGNACFAKDIFGIPCFRFQVGRVLFIEPLEVFLVWLTRIAIRVDHFVKCQICVPRLFLTI